MSRVEWAQAAIDDLRVAETYLAGHAAPLADDLVERIVAAGRFLLDFPAIGSPMRGRWRKWRVPRTRYVVLYLPTRNGIRIGRIRYDRSDWKPVP